MFDYGELRDVLEIHKVIKKPNKLGIKSKETVLLYRLRCKKSVQSSNEYLAAERENESQKVRFLINSRRPIYLDNIVIYKGEKYDIKHINPYLDTSFVELICEVKR